MNYDYTKNIFKLTRLVKKQVTSQNGLERLIALLILPTTQDFVVEPSEPKCQRTF